MHRCVQNDSCQKKMQRCTWNDSCCGIFIAANKFDSKGKDVHEMTFVVAFLQYPIKLPENDEMYLKWQPF
jgi:hypothetical protein